MRLLSFNWNRTLDSHSENVGSNPIRSARNIINVLID